jgi:hypothetical protein
LGRIFVHADDFSAGNYLKTHGVANKLRWTDQDDVETKLIDGTSGSRHNLMRRVVPAQGIQG